jgi:alkanesulfonate monooxygenase SsuD/methylene tetrahydromethanopterin reductase-like flavin-dependent oxidoreductase (luciferase family)
MKLGLFIQPLHFPEREPGDCWDDDLDLIVHGDKIGFAEVWIGEHYCIGWENLPAPELLIAKALSLTTSIRLGSGVHVLAYHHPAVIAHKVAALDHLSKGRFLFGIGAGGSPADFEMFGIDLRLNEHRERMVESIEMIQSLWASDGPLFINGKFWKLKIPFPNKKMTWYYHLKPFQRPHPPIAVAGTSPFSETLRWGAEKGFIPMSIDANTEILKSHWIAIEEGAKKGERNISRADWRIARVVYVAETDEEAYSHVRESSIARGFKEYFLRVYKMFDGLNAIKHDLSIPDSVLDLEYALEHLWIVGSVDTVQRKLEKFYTVVGGFGTLLVLHFDTHPHPERFQNSMTLLKEQVLPGLRDLKSLLNFTFLFSDPLEMQSIPA